MPAVPQTSQNPTYKFLYTMQCFWNVRISRIQIFNHGISLLLVKPIHADSIGAPGSAKEHQLIKSEGPMLTFHHLLRKKVEKAEPFMEELEELEARGHLVRSNALEQLPFRHKRVWKCLKPLVESRLPQCRVVIKKSFCFSRFKQRTCLTQLWVLWDVASIQVFAATQLIGSHS